MAKKSSTKSNVKTSFTNTKKEKIVVLTTGEKFRNGVSEGGGTKQGFRVVTGKNSGNLRQVKVGSNADTQYNQEGLFTGTGADKAKYSSVNKPIKKPIGMISSQQGKSIVQEADSKINNLSPIDQPTTAPSQGTGTTPLSTPQTGTTPTTPTTPAKTETSNDYITYVNQNTGQEMTLKGSAITEEAKANALKNGYTEASSEISGVKTTPEMAQLQSQIDSATRETDSFMTKLESMIITDKELRGELRTIGAKYKARQSEMEEINKRREVAMTTLGIRTGMRYTGGTGGVMGSILSEEERQGLMRIEQIENDKQEAILNAKKAARDQNFQLYAKLADKAEAKQEAKTKELQALKKAQAEQDTKIAEERKKLDADMEVASIMKEGITDPLEIYARLATSGNVGDYTLGDIISTSSKLKDFNKPAKGTASSGSIVDGIDIETAKMGQIRTLARKLLPPDVASKAIANLSDEEMRDFLLKWNEYNDQYPSELTYTPAPDLLSQYQMNDLGKPIQKSGTFQNETNDANAFLQEYLNLTNTKQTEDTGNPFM